MLSDNVIKDLKENLSFREFQKYIVEQVDTLNTLNGLDQMSNDLAGEEAKVRSKAVKILISILRPIVTFNPKTKPTADEIRAREREYGL
jgi:hypothetical protein